MEVATGQIASINGDERRSVTNSLLSRALSLSVGLNTGSLRKFSMRKKNSRDCNIIGETQSANREIRREV
jgi:hypothetical protein